MPGNRDDDDAPRWELPVWDPSTEEAAPSWEPAPQVSRRPPRRGAAPGPRLGPGARPGFAVHASPKISTVYREPPKPVSPLAVPFVWWAAHPWAVLWTLVFLAPTASLLLRVLDESQLDALMRPLAWALSALFLIALSLALVASARRSAASLALGTIAVIATLATVMWPMTRVTLGRVSCPARAGGDLGALVASGALDGWRAGTADVTVWRTGEAAADWTAQTRGVSLFEYQRVESGCWERAAPIDATRTWHEYRVTVQEAERPPLSKIVVIHTAAGIDGWKITAIEGPLP
jgi:hypothetical protein